MIVIQLTINAETMKKLHSLYLMLPVVAILAQACGDNERAKNYNDKTLVDQRGLAFITTANEAGMMEIKASTLATKLSKNQRVINFAKMMINDHTAAGAEVSKLAKDQLVDIPDTISAPKQKSIDSLNRLTGTSFDSAYMAMMVKDHQAAVQLFQEETSNKTVGVRALAYKLLPKLKMHLDSANAICNSLK